MSDFDADDFKAANLWDDIELENFIFSLSSTFRSSNEVAKSPKAMEYLYHHGVEDKDLAQLQDSMDRFLNLLQHKKTA